MAIKTMQRYLLFLTLLPILAHSQPAINTGTYIPLSYTINSKVPECLYERISSSSEHLTSSVFVIEGSELKALITIEGPVAPIDVDLNTVEEYSGQELAKFLTKYDKEGPKSILNEEDGETIHYIDIVDFESEYTEEVDDMPDHWSEEEIKQMHLEQEERERRLEMQKREEMVARRDARREHVLQEQVEKEFEYDDDFVKLQMEEKGGDPRRGGAVARKRRDERTGDNRGRRLSEALAVGEPYQKTFLIKTPGWYRFCVRARSDTIEAEMELRKSSTYGKVDPKTGHVPSLEDVEIHSEIRALFDKEDDAVVVAEEEAIKDEDFRTTHEQLRVLERVYHDIIDKQLEERRVWGWRTVHNKHSYSHMVMGNLVETCLYMIITGWQVYTIRKWFSGGPALGK